MQLKRSISLASVILLTATLVACSSGGTSAPPPTPPASGAFDLTVSTDKLPVITGTSATVTVNVARQGSFNGPVSLSLAGLPSGASSAPVTIAEGQSSATLTVSALGTASHSQPTTVALTGASNSGTVTKNVTVTVRGPAGSLDTTFGANGIAVTPIGIGEDVPYAMAVQDDGKLVVVGSTMNSTTSSDFAVVRYTRDGALDSTFGQGGKVVVDFAGKSDIARAVAIDAQGRVVVAGGVTSAADKERFGVVRLTATGARDGSFGQNGLATLDFGGESRAQAVLVTPSAIVVGGQATVDTTTGVDFAVARLTQTGALDASFGTGGKVTTAVASGNGGDAVRALALQGTRIVAAGGDGDFKAVRYTTAGVLDASFAAGGKLGTVFGGDIATVNAVTVDAQGRLVLAGQRQNDTAIVRLNENGAFDASFGSGGKQVVPISAANWDAATGVAVQSDGKLVLGGWAYEGGSSAGNFAVTRLTASGQLDASFGQGGTTVTSVAPGSKADEVRAVVLQPDERIPATRVVAVGVRNDSNQDFALTRYWP
ncbi:hypothetical protein [Deinococcus yavapaiensis]|uniref:Putative delta-60 repeat protein n=1 Tax=Deinococcus yavapaiensis KR-236 TaxID=694435 RepID=A0A318SBI0_9DEIO|nr:hypothetical protein [Deinococcus yavapaiensis]PYE55714.1 putative delta-60 repeat protein [Deinococcus yavapaiensis KR-236]